MHDRIMESANTRDRKLDHLNICLKKDVEAARRWFDDIVMIHKALPEIDMEQIDLHTVFLGFEFEAPILIASMTGGHHLTKEFNSRLAAAAEETGIGIGVGSQRAALEDRTLEDSFSIVREMAPTSFVYGNIGVAQVKDYGIEAAERAVEMIDADALAIHLNFLQEAIQPEGDVSASGCLDIIKEVCSALKVPVIVKETGAGISEEVAQQLQHSGVDAIDVGGLGGTSFAGVEAYRAGSKGNTEYERLGKIFWNWGIPTPVSIIATAGFLPVIATGGIRSGLDIARSIGLGASLAGAALPFLKAADESTDKLIEKIKLYKKELEMVLFLTGSKDITDLKKTKTLVLGTTGEFLKKYYEGERYY